MLDPKKYNKGPDNGHSSSKYGSLTIYKDDLSHLPEARRALCPCSNTVISDSKNLPFFVGKPGENMDSYYCGHFGFD